MKRKVIVIGGGASGMAAAIWAARTGAAVTVLEHTDRIGKKILSTGNGRCNLTNAFMAEECYRSEQPEFPFQILEKFGTEDTIRWFSEMGLEVKDRQGYYYPLSDQASAVLDVLRMSLNEHQVTVLCGFTPVSVKKSKTGWLVAGLEKYADTGKARNVQIEGDAVILAAGGKAAPNTGSDGSGYELAKMLGHWIIRPLPALVQLRCQGNYYKQLSGIRTDAELTLYIDRKSVVRERGELQLTDYGLSGIPTFQISRYASRALDEKKNVTVSVDFFPEVSEAGTKKLLEERAARFPDRLCEDFLTGLLNKKLAAVLLKLSGIRPPEPCRKLTKGHLEALAGHMKRYQALVLSVNPFANAQVCCGGVDTREINPETMESRIQKNLYIAGELLDVDGICGGYNLQWAWASGYVAGVSAAGGRTAGQKGTERKERQDDSSFSGKASHSPQSGRTGKKGGKGFKNAPSSDKKNRDCQTVHRRQKA